LHSQALQTPASPTAASRAALAFPLIAVGIALALRSILATGTDLYFDEAYYWTWSQRLDWSYFDHPPMTAWLMSVFGARGTALAVGTATVLAIYLFAADFHKDRLAGARAAALWCAVPAGAIAGVFTTPDTPFLLFWTLSLWALHKERWILAGIACGLAALSKYPAVLLGAAWLFWAAKTRRFPRGIWLTLGVGAALFLPVILWNAGHDWEAFRFQLNHGLGRSGGLKTFGEFLGGQLAMGGPVLVPLAVWWIVRGDSRQLLLRVAAAAPLVFFGLSALRSRGEANWAGAAYVAACVGLAGIKQRKLAYASIVTGLLICGAATVHLVHPMVHLKRDVMLSRTQGWSSLTTLRGEKAAALFAPTYQLASEAAYYAGLPTGTAGGGRRSQYDVWVPPHVAAGEDALWLSEGEPPPASLSAGFERVEGPRSIRALRRRNLLHAFKVWKLVDRKDGGLLWRSP
jgi:4-amino-4-deoxy-L-arabinose transferase-like glycosyltransferase